MGIVAKYFHLNHGASKIGLLVAILVLGSSTPTAGSWLARGIFSTRSSQNPVPQNPTAATPKLIVQGNATLAVGSRLHADDQCGGAGGLCNQTTIGIPCGDHEWEGVYCPTDYECKRKTERLWLCQLIPGRTASVKNSSKATSLRPSGGQLLPSIRTWGHGQGTGKSASWSAGGVLLSDDSGEDDGPIVPVCGPDSLPARNSMCNRTSKFIVPADQLPVPTSAAAAGLRSSGSSSLLVLALRLGIALLAAAVASGHITWVAL